MKDYKEFFSESDNNNYYPIKLVNKIIENKLSIELYQQFDHFFHENERMLELFFEGKIRGSDWEIVFGIYNLGSSIDLFRAFFKDVTETRSVNQNQEIIELTAFGKSKLQNRRVIAFRGKFKNGFLESFEDSNDQCEFNSFSYSTPPQERKYSFPIESIIRIDYVGVEFYYKISGIRFLNEMLEGGLDLLSEEKIKIIYNSWVESSLNRILDVLSNREFIEYALKPHTKGSVYTWDYDFDKCLDKSKGIPVQLRYHKVKDFFYNGLIWKGNDSVPFKIPTAKSFEIEAKVTQGLLTKKNWTKVFYYIDYIEEAINSYKGSFLFSDNLKIHNRKVYSLLDFTLEKNILEKLEALKQSVISYTADEFYPEYKKYKRKELMTGGIGCLSIIIIFITLIKSCS